MTKEDKEWIAGWAALFVLLITVWGIIIFSKLYEIAERLK